MTTEPWRGFYMYNQSEETIFEYVRISGGYKNSYEGDGGGINMTSSNPILRHVKISDNTTENIHALIDHLTNVLLFFCCSDISGIIIK